MEKLSFPFKICFYLFDRWGECWPGLTSGDKLTVLFPADTSTDGAKIAVTQGAQFSLGYRSKNFK